MPISKSTPLIALLVATSCVEAVIPVNYKPYVTEHLNTLMDHGRDHYGPENNSIFMSVIDLSDMNAPTSENYAPDLCRGEADKRALRGSNLWWQTELMHLLDKVGDQHPAMETAMLNHIDFFISEISYTRNGQTNLPWWGDHIYYDAHDDTLSYISKHEHQIAQSWDHQKSIWPLLWRADTARTTQIINEIWNMHVVDKDIGWVDRHATNNTKWARGFTHASATCIETFAFMWKKSGKSKWRMRAEKIRDNIWNSRNPATNLIPHVTNDALNNESSRWESSHQTPYEAAFYVPSLVEAYHTFNGQAWINQATAIMTAVYNYGYDSANGGFYRTLQLDGNPVLSPSSVWPDLSGKNVGKIAWWGSDVCRNTLYGARGFMAVYEVTLDSTMLAGAKRYADPLLTREPKTYKHSSYNSTFAGNYAEAIQLLLWVYQQEGNTEQKHMAL